MPKWVQIKVFTVIRRILTYYSYTFDHRLTIVRVVPPWNDHGNSNIIEISLFRTDPRTNT